jgi:hypothetical protein
LYKNTLSGFRSAASLNYRFGKLNETAKKSRKGIGNDDVKGAPSGN